MCPYARYGETVDGVVATIEGMRAAIERGLDRRALQEAMPPGAARNAIDCALWDLDAKRSGVPAHVSAGIDRLRPVATAYTISLDEPAAMAEAVAASDRPILKIKLGAPEGDLERISAVRRRDGGDADRGCERGLDRGEPGPAPRRLRGSGLCPRRAVPWPRATKRRAAPRPVPLCADESVHDRQGPRLVGLYDAVNIKLDKTGGLTEAFALADAAQRAGFALMIGCMVGTSLAMALALLLAPRARFVDLDGPLLLARDREDGLRYEGSLAHLLPRLVGLSADRA